MQLCNDEKKKQKKKQYLESRFATILPSVVMKYLLSYSPAHIQRAPTALLLNISQQLLSLRLMLMNLLSFKENELKIDFSFLELFKTSINDNLLYQLFFKIAQI